MTALASTSGHSRTSDDTSGGVWQQLLDELTTELNRLRSLALGGEEFDSRQYDLVVLQYNAFLRRVPRTSGAALGPVALRPAYEETEALRAA
jgi:hypothetical protein